MQLHNAAGHRPQPRGVARQRGSACCAPPPRPAARVQARKQQQAPQDAAQQAEEEAYQREQQQQQDAEGGGFSAVVSRLLHRAASSLTRGTTTCLACAGKGTCTCPACQGTGVTEKDTRQNAMRHTAQKLRSVLNVERSEYHSDWLTSNRCRRCHGTGVMLCPNCQGQGKRH